VENLELEEEGLVGETTQENMSFEEGETVPQGTPYTDAIRSQKKRSPELKKGGELK